LGYNGVKGGFEMGSLYLILGLVFSLIIAIVAIANNENVTVSYIFGRSEVSLILLILGSAVTGALAMGLFSLFRSIRSAFAFRELRHQQDVMQKQLKTLEEEKIFLQAELNKAVSAPGSEEFETGAELILRQILSILKQRWKRILHEF
jgi:lipopolysaccharide assembly protein A